MLHEHRAKASLAIIPALLDYIRRTPVDLNVEMETVLRYLDIDPETDPGLRDEISEWFRVFERNLRDPRGDMRFPSEASPYGKPMRSLRDVEEQVPLWLNRGRG